MSDATERLAHGNKVPPVTVAFWVIKIAATTLGETAGDALSMTLDLGYAVSTVIFFALFAATVTAQIRARRFHPFLYWTVIVVTTTVGTTMADLADRSLARPLGATLGDFLTKPTSTGGLSLGRFSSSAVLLAIMIALLVLNARRHEPETGARAPA
jgi:uncharacterized membrane-anchored protein